MDACPWEVKIGNLVSNGDLGKSTEIDLGALTDEEEGENKSKKRREGRCVGRVQAASAGRES